VSFIYESNLTVDNNGSNFFVRKKLESLAWNQQEIRPPKFSVVT
jgi:hypothetical protein